MLICCNFCGLEDDTRVPDGWCDVAVFDAALSPGGIDITMAACYPCQEDHFEGHCGGTSNVKFGHLAEMTKYVEGGYVVDSTPVAWEATP